MTNKVYRSAMGKEVDLGALLLQNEQVRAVGNMNVNARGDVLDSANRVIDAKNRQVQRQYKKQTNVSGESPVYASSQKAKQAALEPDNLENFLKITVPHQQFSGFCTLQIDTKYTIGPEFWQWFSKYKQAFVDQWQLDDWTPLHQNGAIELATLLNSQEEFNALKKNFKKFERIYIDHE